MKIGLIGLGKINIGKQFIEMRQFCVMFDLY